MNAKAPRHIVLKKYVCVDEENDQKKKKIKL